MKIFRYLRNPKFLISLSEAEDLVFTTISINTITQFSVVEQALITVFGRD